MSFQSSLSLMSHLYKFQGFGQFHLKSQTNRKKENKLQSQYNKFSNRHDNFTIIHCSVTGEIVNFSLIIRKIQMHQRNPPTIFLPKQCTYRAPTGKSLQLIEIVFHRQSWFNRLIKVMGILQKRCLLSRLVFSILHHMGQLL